MKSSPNPNPRLRYAEACARLSRTKLALELVLSYDPWSVRRRKKLSRHIAEAQAEYDAALAGLPRDG